MKRSNFFKQILLPAVAGVAGLAVVAGVAFQVVVHKHNSNATAAAITNSSANLQDETTTNTSGNAQDANDANDVNNVNDLNNVSDTNNQTTNVASAANLANTGNQVANPEGNTSNAATTKSSTRSEKSGSKSGSNSGSKGGSTSRSKTGNTTQTTPPLNPGTLGEPANSPAGPTPSPGSPVDKLVISAAKKTLELGTPDEFTIHGYKHGKPVNLAGQHVTYQVSGPNDGSSVNSSGVFTAKDVSIYQVVALLDGVQSNLVTLDVQPKTHPYKVTLKSSNNLVAGSSQQSIIMVHVVDVTGRDVQGASVTFSDSNSNVVSISGTKETTDINGMASVQASSGSQTGSATVTVKVNGSGESASTTVVVNAKPVKVELVGKVVLEGYSRAYFLVKVEDAKGNGIPGVATQPTVSGGADLAVNQYSITSDGSGVVKVPMNILSNSPIQATVPVLGSDVKWSGTLTH